MISAEIGGCNSFEPLVTGARVGLPVLDADGMGRAFPELQVCHLHSCTKFILGGGAVMQSQQIKLCEKLLCIQL